MKRREVGVFIGGPCAENNPTGTESESSEGTVPPCWQARPRAVGQEAPRLRTLGNTPAFGGQPLPPPPGHKRSSLPGHPHVSRALKPTYFLPLLFFPTRKMRLPHTTASRLKHFRKLWAPDSVKRIRAVYHPLRSQVHADRQIHSE